MSSIFFTFFQYLLSLRRVSLMILCFLLDCYNQILGSGMSNRMWENTVEHAKTCVMGGKLYVYYTDETHSTGVVFNHIYELRGLIADGQFLPLESLTYNQKVEYFKTSADTDCMHKLATTTLFHQHINLHKGIISKNYKIETLLYNNT